MVTLCAEVSNHSQLRHPESGQMPLSKRSTAYSCPSRARAVALGLQRKPFSDRHWLGAPFYEDRNGQPRILALLHLAISDSDLQRPTRVEQYAAKAIDSLLRQARAGTTEDEVHFANQGLIVVTMPGDFLTHRGSYRTFHEALRLEEGRDCKSRVAFIDDLDLLRILPVDADRRFQALLELVLPRFLNSSQGTYHASDAVARSMFFGRETELEALDSKNITVVYSGRKMGKSSLMRQHLRRCREHADRQAVWVGCAGVAPWRSSRVLEDIAREIKALLKQKGIDEGLDWERETAFLSSGAERDTHFRETLERVKTRFSDFFKEAASRLQSRCNLTRLSILLDEADSLVSAERIENSGSGLNVRSSISWFLRDQEAAHQRFLRVIFAGYDELGRKENLCHSAFGHWGDRMPLNPLEESAAKLVVIKPLAALGILVDQDLVVRILDHTSGHASLIQAFCGELIEQVRRGKPAWPLEDVTLDVEDVRRVVSQSAYQDQMEETLSLNLGIARSYPLELLFYALVSPTGLGGGKKLSLDGFTFEEAQSQLDGCPEPIRELGASTLELALELLVQLGLLEKCRSAGLLENRPSVGSRVYRFKARHYVNHLRTQNAFRERLKQSLEAWNRYRDVAEGIPRHVWTIPDERLAALFGDEISACLVCGLPGSGREYLADLLRERKALPEKGIFTFSKESDWQVRLEAALQDSDSSEGIVVLDLDDHVPWALAQRLLMSGIRKQRSVRWIAGPATAWEVAGDVESFLEFDPIGMGPLTVNELDGWISRRMGDQGGQIPASSSSMIRDSDKARILQISGGLLPVLETMRDYFSARLPDPFTDHSAEEFRNYVRNHRNAARFVLKLARGIPPSLREGLQKIYNICCENTEEEYTRQDIDSLLELCAADLGAWSEPQAWPRLIETAVLLGFIQNSERSGYLRIPYASIQGELVRHPAFVESAKPLEIVSAEQR